MPSGRRERPGFQKFGGGKNACADSDSAVLKHRALTGHQGICPLEHELAEPTGCGQQGLAGNHDPGRSEGSRVVLHHVGVRLADAHPIHGRAESGCHQLGVHRRGAVTELDRTHPDLDVAVGEQPDRGIRIVSAWGKRGDHGECHPGAGLPPRIG